MAMNSVIKKKWINALRSGEYRQGQEFLKSKDGTYCCLGVLCKITGNGSNRDMGASYPMVSYDGVPEDFMGLDGDMQNELAIMNDYGKHDFDSIAYYIESAVKTARKVK